MSSIIERPDGSIVVTVRLTIRDRRLIEAILGARKRKLASMLVGFMLHGMPENNDQVDIDEDDLDLSSLAEIL